MRLDNCKVNVNYVIVSVNCDIKIRRRLFEFGLFPNTPIRVLRKSLFGGVFLLEVRGYLLAIKKKQLGSIEVKNA